MAGNFTAVSVKALTTAGKHHDGDGLYLHVRGPEQRSWFFRYSRDKKQREMGLGAYPAVSLAQARDKAADARKALRDGLDPLAERHKAAAPPPAPVAGLTFRDAAERYIAAKQAGWSNAKHGAQWTATLTTYAFPALGSMSAKDITTDSIHDVLKPIWNEKTETANRVRGRIEAVLDYAAVMEKWTGWTNPAKWKGRLEHLFASRGSVAPVEHHSALPWSDLPTFMASLRQRSGTAARALEWTILTVARTESALGATWKEIDKSNRSWTIPAERMKGKKGKRRSHRVPLSDAAIAVMDAMLPLRDEGNGDYIFPGDKLGKPLSNMAMLKVLERMGLGTYTVHGFRSTFADWRAESTNHLADLQEAALAHTLGDAVQEAYQRGDQFEKRRVLMQDWADYCASAGRAKQKAA